MRSCPGRCRLGVRDSAEQARNPGARRRRGAVEIRRPRGTRGGVNCRAPFLIGSRIMPIGQDSVVTIHYTLKDDAGEVLDSSREGGEPIAYLHGHGNLVPGLERELEGKNAGDKVVVSVTRERRLRRVRQEPRAAGAAPCATGHQESSRSACACMRRPAGPARRHDHPPRRRHGDDRRQSPARRQEPQLRRRDHRGARRDGRRARRTVTCTARAATITERWALVCLIGRKTSVTASCSGHVGKN